MKINGQGPVNFWSRILETYRRPVNEKEKGAPAKEDTLQLSPEGQFIQEIKALANRDNFIRVEVVEAIRTRLETGNYNVPAADLAEAILKEMGR